MARNSKQEYPHYNDTIPTCLRKLRKEAGVPQHIVAEAIGITRQCLSNYENGQSSPDLDRLDSLANYYGVSADYIRGASEVKTADVTVQAMAEYTGLSADAIIMLHDYKQSATDSAATWEGTDEAKMIEELELIANMTDNSILNGGSFAEFIYQQEKKTILENLKVFSDMIVDWHVIRRICYSINKATKISGDNNISKCKAEMDAIANKYGIGYTLNNNDTSEYFVKSALKELESFIRDYISPSIFEEKH